MSGPEGWEWDEEKAAWTLEHRGISFDTIHDLDHDAALTWIDGRRLYEEIRICALAPDRTTGRLYAFVYTWRDETRRLISLRKANLREKRRYDEYRSPRR